ncbi:phage tail assembly chaperone [Duganella lactea]|uniref:phage tail assembly chaperone n=1 Tax=Duganella lactea TaxID=2692173 RepID=UPI003FCEC04F
MVEYARASLKLSTKQDDGHTLEWHLNVIYEQSGEMPPELDVPPIPHELVHVWEYFCQLSAKRTNGGMAANPISDEQIMAWERRHGFRLTPFEGECIDALDEVFLSNQ